MQVTGGKQHTGGACVRFGAKQKREVGDGRMRRNYSVQRRNDKRTRTAICIKRSPKCSWSTGYKLGLPPLELDLRAASIIEHTTSKPHGCPTVCCVVSPVGVASYEKTTVPRTPKFHLIMKPIVKTSLLTYERTMTARTSPRPTSFALSPDITR